MTIYKLKCGIFALKKTQGKFFKHREKTGNFTST